MRCLIQICDTKNTVGHHVRSSTQTFAKTLTTERLLVESGGSRWCRDGIYGRIIRPSKPFSKIVVVSSVATQGDETSWQRYEINYCARDNKGWAATLLSTRWRQPSRSWWIWCRYLYYCRDGLPREICSWWLPRPDGLWHIHDVARATSGAGFRSEIPRQNDGVCLGWTMHRIIMDDVTTDSCARTTTNKTSRANCVSLDVRSSEWSWTSLQHVTLLQWRIHLTTRRVH